jgi:hypothetical protein
LLLCLFFAAGNVVVLFVICAAPGSFNLDSLYLSVFWLVLIALSLWSAYRAHLRFLPVSIDGDGASGQGRKLLWQDVAEIERRRFSYGYGAVDCVYYFHSKTERKLSIYEGMIDMAGFLQAVNAQAHRCGIPLRATDITPAARRQEYERILTTVSDPAEQNAQMRELRNRGVRTPLARL